MATDQSGSISAGPAEVPEQRRGEQELRESEARKAAMLEAALDAIISIDADGHILEFNPAAERTFGYSREEAMGRELADLLIPPAYRDLHREGLAHYLRTGEGPVLDSRVELSALRADGTEIPVELTVTRVPQKGPPQFLGFLRDISEPKQAREELSRAEARYRNLVEQIPAVMYIDVPDEVGSGTYSTIYISPQHERFFGFTAQEIEDDPGLWPRMLHPEDRKRALEEDARHYETGKPLRHEFRVIAKDGHVMWLRDEAVMREDPDGRYSQGILIDITEQRQAEEELRRSYDLLRANAEERRRMLAYVVSAREEERTRIAGDIHDDPLQKVAAVALRLGILRRSLTDPDQLATIERLEASTDLAIRALRSLLFQLRPRSLDTGGLVSALEEYIQQADVEEPADFRLEADPPEDLSMETSTVAYRTAQEALSNARKHAVAHHVTVHLGKLDDGLLVRIEDDGVGMSTEDETLSRSGHLGVRSMRERVEMAGGWIEIRSRPGEGAVVEFWLPSQPLVEEGAIREPGAASEPDLPASVTGWE
jgi:two-component system sensor histidine kinase UhpB